MMAKDSDAKRLIVTHTLASLNKLGSEEKAIADIARMHEGEMIFVEELMILEFWPGRLGIVVPNRAVSFKGQYCE